MLELPEVRLLKEEKLFDYTWDMEGRHEDLYKHKLFFSYKRHMTKQAYPVHPLTKAPSMLHGMVIDPKSIIVLLEESSLTITYLVLNSTTYPRTGCWMERL